MDLETRLSLIMRSPTEEIVLQEELKKMLQNVRRPRHYIGLELSGKLHLGSLILTGYKINDFINAAADCNVFLADWHTYINNKLHGDWETIREVSKYYTEAFKFFCPGVNIVLGSKMYESSRDYWKNFVEFSKLLTLPRTLRALTIMGRSERDNLDFSQLLYPSMQSVDIKTLNLDIVHSGMDQRRIHMLVREIYPKLGWKVPVSIHHHLLPGLAKPVILSHPKFTSDDYEVSSKMSKSKPSTSITIHDDEMTIQDKVGKAYCPNKVSQNNPVLEIIRYIVFHEFKSFLIERDSKYGGDASFASYFELQRDFESGKIHPTDLKTATSNYLNKIIKPIREHFTNWEIVDKL